MARPCVQHTDTQTTLLATRVGKSRIYALCASDVPPILPPPAKKSKKAATSSDIKTTGRRRGVVVSGVRRMNEVNASRARLVPGWVTVFGRVYHLGM